MEQTDSLFMQYVDTIDAIQKRINLTGMYKWIRAYEKSYEIDVSHFDDSMIVHMLNHQIGLSVSTARRYIDDLDGFFVWGVEEGHIPSSPMQNVTYHRLDFTQPVLKKCFADYRDISSILRRKWTPDEGKATYPITIFAWMGVPIADAAMIMPNDIDLVRGVIQHQSQDVYCVLTEEMKDILRRYTEFRAHARDNDITMIRDFSCKTFLYRLDIQNAKNQSQPGRLVDISAELGDSSRVLRKMQICDGLSYSEIAKSGILKRMYAMECLGESYENILSYGAKILKTPKAYPGDTKLIYNAYKKAFGLK